jgi:hypothetical protein
MVGYAPAEHFPELIATMKKAAAALQRAEIDAILAGGLAVWARGGPPTDHDVDFLIREGDADRALDALAEQGMTPEHPPEGWLVKAHDGDVLVDLIFRPAGGAVNDEHFERADELEVMAQRVLVAAAADILASKLMALTEQEPGFASVLMIGRTLREQIDWTAVRERTEESPFARAYLVLADGLGISADHALGPLALGRGYRR